VVNVLERGCPDVPCLAREMMGRHIEEAPVPALIGHTLWGYALQLAYENMKTPALIECACRHENAGASSLVKGEPDYIADQKGIYGICSISRGITANVPPGQDIFSSTRPKGGA